MFSSRFILSMWRTSACRRDTRRHNHRHDHSPFSRWSASAPLNQENKGVDMRIYTRICSSILLSMTLSGCFTSGTPSKYRDVNSKDGTCNYSALAGKSYIINEELKATIAANFFFNPDKEKYLQINGSVNYP